MFSSQLVAQASDRDELSRENHFGVPICMPVKSSHERALIVAILVVLLPFGPLVFSAAAQPTTNATPAQVFELQVVGPDGKPVPEVVVGIRIDPPLRLGKQITRGTVARMGGYQTDVKADADGRVALEFPPNPKRFIVSIVQPGYGPYWAEWSSAEHPERIPASFSAELAGGWTVGGVIVDSRGNPIEGAKVHRIRISISRSGRATTISWESARN
jgi:hypothetical protein